MRTPIPDKIILFDSLCNLCNGWSRFVLKRDTSALFTLCRVQSPAGQRLLGQLGLPLDTFETVIYLERCGESLADYHKSDATWRIMAQLSAPWRYLAWLRLVPKPVRDLAYDGVARNRYRLFGKRQSCQLPGEDERQRFLEEFNDESV